MDDEEALKESVSNLRSAILLHRTDIIRSILSTAADCKKLIVISSIWSGYASFVLLHHFPASNKVYIKSADA